MSFRVTQEEYERLCNSCSATGARCVSDLARTAIGWIAMAATDPGITDLVSACETLERVVRQLRIEVEHRSNLRNRPEAPAVAGS